MNKISHLKKYSFEFVDFINKSVYNVNRYGLLLVMQAKPKYIHDKCGTIV